MFPWPAELIKLSDVGNIESVFQRVKQRLEAEVRWCITTDSLSVVWF